MDLEKNLALNAVTASEIGKRMVSGCGNAVDFDSVSGNDHAQSVEARHAGVAQSNGCVENDACGHQTSQGDFQGGQVDLDMCDHYSNCQAPALRRVRTAASRSRRSA